MAGGGAPRHLALELRLLTLRSHLPASIFRVSFLLDEAFSAEGLRHRSQALARGPNLGPQCNYDIFPARYDAARG